MPICLRANNVSKIYSSGLIKKRARLVLDDVSLEIEEGKTFGLVGESGSGKTTLGKMLAGLEVPSTGNVVFHDKKVAEMNKLEFSRFRRSVQMVFQDPEGSLNPRKSIQKSLFEVLHLIEAPKAEWKERTLEILDTVGLSSEILCRYPSQISGGQNQRVALGRVLLLEPEVIILDEPTSALDISVQAQILMLLKDLQRQWNIGYLFISHDIDVIRFMAHKVGLIEKGRLKLVFPESQKLVLLKPKSLLPIKNISEITVK